VDFPSPTNYFWDRRPSCQRQRTRGSWPPMQLVTYWHLSNFHYEFEVYSLDSSQMIGSTGSHVTSGWFSR
jgi:hypothetical protein